MRYQKMLLGVLSVLIVVGASGCTTKESSSSGTDSQNNANTEKTTISVWAMGEEAKKLDEVVKPFEEKTGYDVEVQAIPWGEAHTKLLTAVAAKSGPDVIQLGTSWMPEFVEAGALLDLSSYSGQYENMNQDRFFDGSTLTTNFDNGVYGVPLYVDTRVLFYRTDLLESVGYPAAPKTWEELKDASSKLNARGDDLYGMNWDLKEQALIFILANQQGANFYGTDYGTDYTVPEFQQAAEYLLEFLKNGDSLLDASIDAVQGFKDDGALPMFVSGPWMVGILQEQAPELEGKWATAVLPSGSQSNFSVLGGTNLTVFSHSKNIDPSVEFVNFMAEVETQKSWFTATKTLPSVKSVWDEMPELKDDPLVAVMGEQLKTAKPMPLSATFEEVAQLWIQEFERVYRGGEDLPKVIQEFNTQAATIQGP